MKIKFFNIEIKRTKKYQPVHKPKYVKIQKFVDGNMVTILEMNIDQLKIMLDYYGANSLDIELDTKGFVHISPPFQTFISF